MGTNTFSPVCMTEEYWANTYFSIARHTGEVKISSHEYIIVNKEGKDIYECSFEAEKAGREKAIEPGEPADLCRKDFVKFYRALGREKFLKVLEDHSTTSDMELTKIYKQLIKK